MRTGPRIVRFALFGLWPVIGGIALWLVRPNNDDFAPIVRLEPRGILKHGRTVPAADDVPVQPVVNPFRLDRQGTEPSRVAVAIEAPSETEAPKLTGIVWGSPPSAIIEGLAGTGGPVVLRQGDEKFGVRVVRVGPAGVTLLAKDATWHLRLNSTPGIGQ